MRHGGAAKIPRIATSVCRVAAENELFVGKRTSIPSIFAFALPAWRNVNGDIADTIIRDINARATKAAAQADYDEWPTRRE